MYSVPGYNAGTEYLFILKRGKRMKKVLSIMLTLAMIISMMALVSCGDNGGSSTTTTKSAESTKAATESKAATETKAATTEASGDKPVLVMATNATFPPYEYTEGEKFVGIDIEIATALAEKLGMTLEIKNVEFDSILPGIQSGSFTIGMAGMTVTAERLETVNFSTPYAKGVQVVIVKEGSEIASIDDLTGKKIGVQSGTTGDIYASDGYGEENVSKYTNGPDAVQALVSGKVDAVIIDNEPAKNYVAANEGLKILETSYADEDYAIAIAKSDTELLNKINDALKALTDDGTVPAIIEKYIPTK